MAEWERSSVTLDRMISIIKEKKYKRKEAQKFLADNVNLLYNTELETLLERSTVQFNETLTKYFNEVASCFLPVRQTLGILSIPFDFKGVLAGGLGTIVALVCFLILAHITGLISVGAPITIGLAIAIAVGSFFAARMAVGDTWRHRIVRSLHSKIQNEHLFDQYTESIDQHWLNIVINVDREVDSLITQYEGYINNQRTIAASQNPDQVLKHADIAKMMRRFFSGTPLAVSIP